MDMQTHRQMDRRPDTRGRMARHTAGHRPFQDSPQRPVGNNKEQWDPIQQNLKDELVKVHNQTARYVMNIYLEFWRPQVSNDVSHDDVHPVWELYQPIE